MKRTFVKEIIKLMIKRPLRAKPLKVCSDYDRWMNFLEGEGRSSLADEQPWFTFEAIDFVDRILDQSMIGFEYGCGGSTVFLAQRMKSLVSVEHDQQWFNLTRAAVQAKPQLSWQGNLIPCNPDLGFDKSKCNHPDYYYSSDNDYAGNSFAEYVKFIDNYPDEYFDLVLVDGRARPSCLKHSMSKIKPNGYLILDNSDRSYYLTNLDRDRLNGDFKLLVDSFGPGPYNQYFWGTSIWQKTIK
jgi:hypothetical protein